VQFVADGRRLSLNDLADLLAEKVTTRITFARERSVQPQQPVGRDEPKVVSVPEAAKLLGLSRSTVWRYIEEKRIETIHLGPRSTRIRMETINRLVKDGIPD
jgi:excisionase family DNA binding protein